MHPEPAGLELDDGHADVGGDAAEAQRLLLLEQPYAALHRLIQSYHSPHPTQRPAGTNARNSEQISLPVVAGEQKARRPAGGRAGGREGYLGADGAAVEERAEREGEPGEVEVEPPGPAGLRLRAGRGRDGEPRPAGAGRRGADVVGRVRGALRQAERPRGGTGGDGCCCCHCCSGARSLRLGKFRRLARRICRRGGTDGWMGDTRRRRVAGKVASAGGARRGLVETSTQRNGTDGS